MRTIAMLLFSSMLVLSACSGASDADESSSEANGNGNTSSEQNNNEDDADADNNESDENGDDEADENDAGENNEANNDGDDEDDEGDETFEQKEPEYEMNEDNYIEPIDDADSKVVLLTIDDAPDEHAVEMAEKLKEMDAPAIFYINKMYVDEDGGEEKLEKIHDMGFPLGNHTDTHPNLSELSEDEQEEELEPVYDQIEDITGDPVKFFRAPHGVNTDVSDDIADEQDVLPMNWSYGYDFKADYEDADKLTDIMLEPDPPELLHDGAILLMHDRDWTNEALEDIVEGLRDQGYEMLDPELLKTPQSPE